MTILATAKAKLNGTKSVKEAFKNEDGAIDLASIMVGIIVIGIIGGVIAATVFAVIPWAQNNGAKQQLDSVASAESAYIGLSSDQTGTGVTTADGNVAFGTGAQLQSAKLFTAPTNVAVTAGGSGSAAHYAAAVKSTTGSFFYITDQNTKAQPYTGSKTAVADVATEELPVG